MSPTAPLRSFALDSPYDAHATLRGGQAFRWRCAPPGSETPAPPPPGARQGARDSAGQTCPGDGWHTGVVMGRAISLRAQEGSLEWSSSGCPADALGTYLRLGDPHAAIRKRLGEDPTLFDAVHRFPGLRLVKNDPWECLANFLTSMVKSVGEIENCAERLARACGERTPDGVWRFPEPGVVARADEGKLRRLTGIGFRARYLRAAGLAVDRGDVDLAGLERAAYGDAVEALMALDGVGRKVADCVALYGLGKLEAFPVDTHVRRAMERSLFRAKKQPYDAISDLAAARWGPLAGYAQQWLFHSERLARRRPPPEGPRSNP